MSKRIRPAISCSAQESHISFLSKRTQHSAFRTQHSALPMKRGAAKNARNFNRHNIRVAFFLVTVPKRFKTFHFPGRHPSNLAEIDGSAALEVNNSRDFRPTLHKPGRQAPCPVLPWSAGGDQIAGPLRRTDEDPAGTLRRHPPAVFGVRVNGGCADFLRWCIDDCQCLGEYRETM
jgi:hypothetical protein